MEDYLIYNTIGDGKYPDSFRKIITAISFAEAAKCALRQWKIHSPPALEIW